MTTEERLGKVEREQAETKAEVARAKWRVRRLVIAGAVALACVGALMVAGVVVPPEVRARAFFDELRICT
jgi:hypothetical protein